MAILPLIPDWQQLHPLIVHFPIALLLVAPIFICIGIFRAPPGSAPFLVSALLLMIMGTATIYFALQTGIAARSQTHLSQELTELLQRHQASAETATLTFMALTIVFGAIILTPRLLSREPSRVITTVLPAVFLLLYAAGAVLLANTAHMGGCLVHQFGVTGAQGAGSHEEALFRHK